MVQRFPDIDGVRSDPPHAHGPDACADEAARLGALHAYKVLDSPPQIEFDAIVEIAAKICDVPIALVSLVDGERQWFKAEIGFGQRETPRSVSVCSHAITQRDVFLVEDLSADPRFADSPLVSGESNLRFYAGAPIITAQGHALGTVCVMDRVPRQLDAAKLDLLAVLARQALLLLDQRKSADAWVQSHDDAQRNAQFLHRSLDALAEMVAIVDAKGAIVYVNQAWTGFAYSNASADLWPRLGVGANYLEVCAVAVQRGSAEAAQVALALQAALAGSPEKVDTEYPCHGAGAQRWFVARVSGFQIGRYSYAIVTHQNITDRKLAELAVGELNDNLELRVQERTAELKDANQRLQVSEARFRAIFEDVGVGFAVAGLDGKLQQFNAAYCAIMGRDAASLKETQLRELVHPDDLAELESERRKMLRGVIPGVLLEVRILRPDGETIWIHASITAVRNNAGHPVQTVALVQNISRRRRAEYERDRFFRLSADLFVIMDFDGTIQRVNAACTQLTGIAEEDLVGHSYQEFLGGVDWRQVRDELQRVVEGRSTGYVDLKMRLHDGDARDIRWGAASWPEERLFMLVGRDVTDSLRAQVRERRSREQLRALAAQLQEVRETERMAISREIHDELGQMLTALKMDLSLLARDVQGATSVADIQQLERELQGAGELVDTTLRAARRLARQLRPEQLDTQGLVAAIETYVAEFDGRAQMQCHVSAPQGEPRGLAAEQSTSLFRIVQESLTNVARHARATRVDVELRQIDGWLQVCVRDDGCGFDQDDVEGATSLGLLGMRERAQMMGGELLVDSSPGQGTVVTVRLPLPPSEDA